MSIIFVTKDGNEQTVDVAKGDGVGGGASWLGPIISQFVEIVATESKYDIAATHSSRLDVAELDDSAASAPLIAFLRLGLLDFSEALADFDPEALRVCYEASLGRLNIPVFVEAVERRIVKLLLTGNTVPAALRGMTSIETLIRAHAFFPWPAPTPFVVRRAIEEHSAVVVVLQGMKRAFTVFNMAFKEGGNIGSPVFRIGALTFLCQLAGQGDLMNEDEIDAWVGIRDVAASDRVLVYSCDLEADIRAQLLEPDTMGMDEPEFMYGSFIGDAKFVGEGTDVLLAALSDAADVDAIIGYGGHCANPRATNLAYVRDQDTMGLIWKMVV